MCSIQWSGGSQSNLVVGPVKALVKFWSNLVNPGLLWSNLVKPPQTSRNAFPTMLWEFSSVTRPLSGRADLVWVASFCVSTPEKITGVKIGMTTYTRAPYSDIFSSQQHGSVSWSPTTKSIFRLLQGYLKILGVCSCDFNSNLYMEINPLYGSKFALWQVYQHHRKFSMHTLEHTDWIVRG